MTPNEAAVRAAFAACAAKAATLYNVNLSCVLQKFNITSTRLGGQAGRKGHQYYVRWNPTAMAADINDYCNVVVPHEIAHIICYMRPDLGGRSHNAVWRQICVRLGGTGATKVDRDSAAAAVLRAAQIEKRRKRGGYLYRTPSGKEHIMSPIIHRRIQQGTTYRDRTTKESIGLAQFVQKAA